MAKTKLTQQSRSRALRKNRIIPRIPASRAKLLFALGAAMLAGVGTGVWRNFEDAVLQTVRVRKTYEPNPETKDVYDRGYESYRKLYENLKDLMKKN